MNAIRFGIVLVCMMMGFTSTSAAAQTCCDVGSDQAYDAQLSQAERRAITQALEGYATGFINEDIQFLLNLWDDRNATRVSYLPVEQDLPIVGRANLRPYYLNTFAQLDVLSGEVTDVRIFPLRSDLVYASCIYNWVYRSDAGGPSFAQQARGTFVLQKRGNRWLYEHFHESITFQP